MNTKQITEMQDTEQLLFAVKNGTLKEPYSVVKCGVFYARYRFT